MKAWHFHNGSTLRDGSPLPPIGEPLVHDGPLAICESGLHFSTRVIDALRYASGHFVDRVEVSGVGEMQPDKGVCRVRTRLWTLDCESLFRDFARRCAFDVVHLWDAQDVAIQYLKTGDESIRAAALDAARAAAWDSARDAAWEAAWDSALDAARNASWDAAWAAVRDAVRAAAGEAARDAVLDAARAAQNRRLTAMIMAAKGSF